MSHARATAVLCACALFANAVGYPAPPPPVTTKKCAHKEAKMIQQDKSFVAVRRIPIAYFYPFSLWPVPKYQHKEQEDSHEIYHYKKTQKTVHMTQNKRLTTEKLSNF